jgi:hypothetical protein
MYKNMSEDDINKRKKAFKDLEVRYHKFLDAPDETTKDELQKLHDDLYKSSDRLRKIRDKDIEKTFKDLDLENYDVRRDVDSAFAEVSDKYIYSSVRKEIKNENRKTKVKAALGKVVDTVI